MNHFYYTWCRAEHSLSGNAGWGIRSVSPGFPEHEAHQLVPHANYQFLDTVSPENSPVRLAYIKHPELGESLIHAVAIGQCPGQSRGGNYFVHCLTDLGENFDGFEAICHWSSPSWVLEDFDSPSGPPPWNAPSLNLDSIDETIGKNLKKTEYFESAMYCLEAFLALDDGQKLFIAGPSDEVAQLIRVVGACLPKKRKKEMTFSTYDSLDSPPNVKIMGCFFVDPATEDFPPYHYQEGFFSLNTYTQKRSVGHPTSNFARGILPLLRDYGGGQVQTIHDFIEQTGRDEPRDHSIIFALHPQQEEPIQLDPDSVHYVMGHWPIQFLEYLPEPRREEFLGLIRKDYHPFQDTKSRDWILNNLDYLKAFSQKSPYMQALLKDLFEENELEASLAYLNYYSSYFDENVPVQSRSRAIYGVGQAWSQPIPSIEDRQMLEALSSHCRMLADKINFIHFNSKDSVPVRLWLHLTWICRNHEDMEYIFQHFGCLANDKQDYFNRILLSYCGYYPQLLKDKIGTFLRYANAHALAIPADTLGNLFEQNDELFFLVFNKLDKNPAYLKQLFRDPNAPVFFAEYSGQNKAMRFKKIVQYSGQNKAMRFKEIVQEEQITKANFEQIRGYVKDKEVDQYLLHSRPLNKIFQSLYNETVANLSLDDFLEENSKTHHLCQRLKEAGYITEESHPILRYLKVNALAQKEKNWAMVRDEPTMFSLINIYHSNRGKPRTEQFLRLYTEYIYTGINHFTDLEKYLKRDPVSPSKEHQDQNRDIKLDLLKQLIELTNAKPAEDPKRRDVIAAIFFYTAILLPDGKTAVSHELSPLKMSPLIDYDLILRAIFFKQPVQISDNTPDKVKTFVGTSLRTFVKRYHGVLDKDLKKQMLAAFKRTSMSQNEVCFGDAAFGPKPWWKKWWVWLIAIIIGIILVMGLKYTVAKKQAAKEQSAIVKEAIRKHLSKKPKYKLTDADFKKVMELNLSNTKITDDGLKELHELENLITLDLRDTEVTEAGVSKLQKALPKCTIQPNAKK